MRPELCEEALRLTLLLGDYRPAATPTTHALGALMCLNAARLPGRVDHNGDLLALFRQDRSRWDCDLLTRGLALFDRSAAGTDLSAYHVEAAIAVVHASAASYAETDWHGIVALYDRLMSVAPSPVVALSRAIALAERDGPAPGLAALSAIADADRLDQYPFYPAAFGELELRLGHGPAAERHFRAAIALARNDAERRFLEKRRVASRQ